MADKSILIIIRKAPYSNSIAKGAIELALASSVFEQKLSLVFTGDGVWQLLAQQQTETLGDKNHGKLLSALPLYDLEPVFVDEQALNQRSIELEDLLLQPELINSKTIKKMMADADTIFCF